MTSNDAVSFIKRRIGRVKIGHAGTLDPEAAGVLPIMVGSATRLFDELADKQKEYIAKWMPGAATDTQDSTGRVIARSERIPTIEELNAVLSRFIGEVHQTPPQYSAIKVSGMAAYERARRGEQVPLAERSVRIDKLKWIEDGETADGGRMLHVVCGRGVYVRTLCEDIGKAVGCAAHMAFLLRIRCGAFDIENAHTLEECLSAFSADDPSALAGLLLPLDFPLQHLPKYDILSNWRERARNGHPAPYQTLSPIPKSGDAGSRVRLYLDGTLAGIGIVGAIDVSFRPILIK
jgi:tRNA pseudouridine55 synthase